jgi:hypothetical protein
LFFTTRRIWADIRRVIQPIRLQNSSYTVNDYALITDLYTYKHELVLLLSYKINSKYTRIIVTGRIFSGNLKKWSCYIVNKSILKLVLKFPENILPVTVLNSCIFWVDFAWK